MARVHNVPSSELPPDLAAICERFAGQYGPFPESGRGVRPFADCAI
jgi:hypothetical protein